MNALFVRGIPSDATEDELLEEFKQYGLVKSLSIASGKGFGYVLFDTCTQAENAIIGTRDWLFKGSQLSLELYVDKHSKGKQS